VVGGGIAVQLVSNYVLQRGQHAIQVSVHDLLIPQDLCRREPGFSLLVRQCDKQKRIADAGRMKEQRSALSQKAR
jgi:hypothetical protein